MKKRLITAGVFLMSLATITGCVKGDKGETGPQGSTGSTGPVGPKGDQGVQGNNGHDGKDGNANVHAGTVTIPSTNWTYNSSNWEYSTTITYAQITKDVVDYGAVMVYVANGSNWFALPYTYYATSTKSLSYEFQYRLGAVDVFVEVSDNSTVTFNPATFKVVAIAGSLKRANPNTNWSDYKEVQALLDKEEKTKNIRP